jgi:hypothetical protein
LKKFKPGSKADDKHQRTPAKPSERVKGSKKNKPGSASTGKGKITLDDATTKGLENKVKEHNEKHPDKKVTLGKLKAVWRRGAGAFSGSHRPGMTRAQWSMGRVNAFLYKVRNGRAKDPKYVQDDDLLPNKTKKAMTFSDVIRKAMS